ncbi:MAG: hypothetical protein OSB70_00685 [Myxococcota bacterium]|nr:hypothetical protein [Myxococcota bacterium]
MNHADMRNFHRTVALRINWIRSLLAMSSLLIVLPAGAFQLSVETHDGSPVQGYEWQVVEDSTHAVEPGTPSADSLSFGIHRSTSRIVARGHTSTSTATVHLPDERRYFVSVVPDVDCPLWGGSTCSSSGGAAVALGDSQVTVYVASGRVPTAQITIRVFEDNQPLNNAMDLPNELPNANGNPTMAGFTIEIDDTYARVQMDVFGNLLGTTYQTNLDGSFVEDATGEPVVDVIGVGVILTNDEGVATIKNLYPGKYGVNALSPSGNHWQQTSTIEGKKTIDAWVKADEPAFFQEFGIPSPHVEIGFVKPTDNLSELSAAPGGIEIPTGTVATTTLVGEIVSMHPSRAPHYDFDPGMPIPNCWVGLNDLSLNGGNGEMVYVQPCNDDSTFSISGVPEGRYSFVAFDTYLTVVFGSMPLLVDAAAPTSTDLGQVKVFQWFGRTEHYVYFDTNEDGFPDPGEPGMPEQEILLRHRDGTVYQAFPTDLQGTVPFDQVFPFFHWLVAEVDFARFKATGVTVMVDAGGPVSPNNVLDPWLGEPTDELMTMQVDPNTGLDYRTETGEVLTQAVQTFLGSTNRFFWGKSVYGPGENGGISGLVIYGVTRAEDDPAFAAAEEWEPGVANAVVVLYQDFDGDGVIDDLDESGDPTFSDLDRFPFGNFPGHEDVDRNWNFTFDSGDAIAITTTDSWDDSLPEGCPGEAGTQTNFPIPGVPGATASDCFEGLRTYNQVRDGTFDGGFAFGGYFPGGISSGSAETSPIPPGIYIVEGNPPALMHTVAEEDKNVDFGDQWTPSALLLPSPCVGDLHTVPQYLNLFTDGWAVESPRAGEQTPLCNRKQVELKAGGFNAGVEFFVTTDVPLPGRAVGIVMSDLGNEFDRNSPNFAEKYAPPNLPIAFYDWKQTKAFSRVYSDEFGAYNSLISSTYNINLPSPSGVSPFMATVCINDPGPIPDPNNPGEMITDPYYNSQYSRFCYTFNFHSGTTTYLDTPVVPTAAFAQGSASPVDCEPGDGEPVIRRVDGPGTAGPVANTGDTITIESMGSQEVPNPGFLNDGTTPQLITRDFGFGTTEGIVSVGGVNIPPANVTWGNYAISVEIPSGLTSGQLVVTRGDNDNASLVGVTLTLDPTQLVRTVPPGGSIQDAIDGSEPGDLIIVSAGTYHENLIVDRAIQLQGVGAGSTVISGTNLPTSRAVAWRALLQAKLDSGEAGLLPGQEDPQAETANGWESGLVAEESPTIMVVPTEGEFAASMVVPRIDGFTVRGGEIAGGILINGFGESMEISNNLITNNVGVYGGGIRIGKNHIEGIVDGHNDGVSVHNNQVTFNAGLAGPGGVAIYPGTDNYVVEDNMVCGNHTGSGGAGIGHVGVSDNGLIRGNTIIFNEAWHGTLAASGGGIQISGMSGGAAAVSPGTGNVTIDANLIQGNSAGTGDGSAISLFSVNGADVEADPTNPAAFWKVDIFNNIMVNNHAGNAGAVAIFDAVDVDIINNTIANNDSTATASQALNTDLLSSVPRGAGIVAYKHSQGLRAVYAGKSYSNPKLRNNIVWHNRSFHWQMSGVGDGTGELVPDPSTPNYNDFEVWGTNSQKWLKPKFSVISDTSVAGAPYGDANMHNSDGDPEFVDAYHNGPRDSLVQVEFKLSNGPIYSAVAFDEGGNFIDIDFGPLKPVGNYHIEANSSAVTINGAAAPVNANTLLQIDYDGEPRGGSNPIDAGADEFTVSAGALCGLGFEAALILPLVQWSLRRRKRKTRICDGQPSHKELGR